MLPERYNLTGGGGHEGGEGEMVWMLESKGRFGKCGILRGRMVVQEKVCWMKRGEVDGDKMAEGQHAMPEILIQEIISISNHVINMALREGTDTWNGSVIGR